jgi:hypothetical protein
LTEVVDDETGLNLKAADQPRENTEEETLEHSGIVYLRTTRKDLPVLYRNDEAFWIGGSKVLRSSKKDVATVVAAGITLKMIFTPEKLRVLIMPKIEEAVGRKVTVNKFSLKVWTGLGVELEGIELANAKGFAEKPMVKVGSIVLKVNLLGLLKRQLVISSLVVDKPEIMIEKDIKGAFNFDDLVKPVPAGQKTAPPPSSSPVSLAFAWATLPRTPFRFSPPPSAVFPQPSQAR